jgi:group I intron endonuclease
MDSGIYSIFCNSNSKYYIGQAVDVNRRIKAHFNKLAANKHHSPYLQHTYNVYGKNSLEFSVLEYCNIDELDNREIYYISKYDSLNPNGFNCTTGGNGMRGFVFSDFTKTNWSVNRKGKYLGKEHPKSKPIKGTHLKNGSILYFDSLQCAERYLNIKGANKNISANCKMKKKSAYGYNWEYDLKNM